jgi:hypothetical protein
VSRMFALRARSWFTAKAPSCGNPTGTPAHSRIVRGEAKCLILLVPPPRLERGTPRSTNCGHPNTFKAYSDFSCFVSVTMPQSLSR